MADLYIYDTSGYERFCGSIPSNLISSSNEMLIEFQSGASSGGGFKIEYYPSSKQVQINLFSYSK